MPGFIVENLISLPSFPKNAFHVSQLPLWCPTYIPIKVPTNLFHTLNGPGKKKIDFLLHARITPI
jgi:hypothetical protein